MAATQELPLTALPSFAAQVVRDVVQGDYQPALKRVAVAAKADFKEHFLTSTGPDGTPWPPIKGFRVRGQSPRSSHPPLRDRGLLMASAAGQGEGHVEEISSLSMEVGTNLAHAEIHNKGGTIYPKHGKALAIPLTLEAWRHGGPRSPSPFPAELHLVWPRGRRFGWLVESKAGTGPHNRGASSILHYMLVPRVVIPQREFIGWSEALLAISDAIIADHAARLAGG